MKLSFSLPQSKASRPAAAKSFHDDDGADTGAATRSHFVTEFDPSQNLASDGPTRHVIAPIPNNSHLLRPTKKMKNLIPHNDADGISAAADSGSRFVLDSSNADAAASAIPYGLTVRSSLSTVTEEDDEEGNNGGDLMLRRYKEDMDTLPEDRGFDEFKDIPVEDFAAAVLAGYGWKEGKGIGRNAKKDTRVVEYNRRAGTEGLGYTPDPSAPKTKDRRSRKPPSSLAVAKAEKEKVVRIVSGKHAGFKGMILERLRNDLVVLKELQSGEELRVGNNEIAELGSVEEERCLRKLKELDIRGRDNRREEKPRDERSRESARESSRRDEKRNRDWEKKHERSLRDKSSDRHEEREEGPVRWLRSHIRVRVISKEFKGGRLYLKKGKVVDVVGPTTCDISMDDSGELVHSVEQKILETALPKRGGSVLVLYGKHKGVYGSLVERDTEEETGVVRDADTHALINVRLEQIAEYIGDPSYIGY